MNVYTERWGKEDLRDGFQFGEGRGHKEIRLNDFHFSGGLEKAKLDLVRISDG